MLFTSYTFIFIFVPAALLLWYLAKKLGHPRIATLCLIIASLIFYGSYNYFYVLLIAVSVLFNYFCGARVSHSITLKRRKLWFATGISLNIIILAYFKYTNFFIENTNSLFGTGFHVTTVLLPVAISFFTITQIAYLFDIYRGQIEKHSLLDYTFFVTFFPKLLSGPIVRFKELVPQLYDSAADILTSRRVAVGVTIFFLGLFKKVVLADSLSPFADIVFQTALQGTATGFFSSWSGALAYTYQIYFDFSGYCDMATGLSLLCGIRLPLNFYSPYKATGIIDFWRRWHMTLSGFIRDYLYIPLGGNRKGFPRQLINLLLAMTIAGMWHGAGWNFLVWGALHGVYLAINHSWRRIRSKGRRSPVKNNSFPGIFSIVLTFLAVTAAWIFFRASNISAALIILKGMIGLNGFALPAGLSGYFPGIAQWLQQYGVVFSHPPAVNQWALMWIILSACICWFLPNAQEYMENYQPTLNRFAPEPGGKPHKLLRWAPAKLHAIAMMFIILISLMFLTRLTGFIYLQF